MQPITFSAQQAEDWVGSLVWPMVRVLGFVASAPVFSSTWIPNYIQVGIGMTMTWCLLPTLPTIPLWPGLGAAIVIVFVQLLIGLSIGLVFQGVLSTVQLAGDWLALTMGLGFSTTISPQYGTPVSTVSEIMGFAVVILLIFDGGVTAMLNVLAESFRVFPVGTTFPDWNWLAFANFGQAIFTGGVLLALPVVLMLLVVNLGMAVVARVAPQVNLFAVGFPVMIMVGLIGLYWLLPWVPRATSHIFALALELF
jgi:flagellar biosynthetic protein FliR